jgi:WD40 repeat protein
MLRDLLAQGVQRLRQIIGAPLDIGPPDGRIGGGQNAFSLSPVVTFSRDNRLIAAATGDNAVKVWDVVTGKELQTLSGSQGSFISTFGVYFVLWITALTFCFVASLTLPVWFITFETAAVDTS